MTGAWPRKQRPHISFIEFQIYPRSADLSGSYRHPHPGNAKGTLVVTDDGRREEEEGIYQSVPPPLPPSPKSNCVPLLQATA